MAGLAAGLVPALGPRGRSHPWTDNGLILLLHNAAVGYDDGTVRYTCGQLLFDPADPTSVLAQMNRPWLEPSTYEDQHTGWSPT